jgi:uncharacterized damage-inducible protein DinB
VFSGEGEAPVGPATRRRTLARNIFGRTKDNLFYQQSAPVEEEAVGPKDIIVKTMDTSDFIMMKYLDDLSDADLKIQPVEGMHPIALQLGHLIAAERMFAEYVSPGLSPELPAGFAENHSLKSDVPDRKFATKDEYLKLWQAQRAATKKALAGISDADLSDTRGGKLPQFAPTVADILNMIAIHSLNHSGQFVAVRRLLKKPIAF